MADSKLLNIGSTLNEKAKKLRKGEKYLRSLNDAINVLTENIRPLGPLLVWIHIPTYAGQMVHPDHVESLLMHILKKLKKRAEIRFRRVRAAISKGKYTLADGVNELNEAHRDYVALRTYIRNNRKKN